MNRIVIMVIACLCVLGTLQAQTVWLDECDLGAMECGWGTPSAKKSIDDHPLTLAGTVYNRGVGTHSVSTMLLTVNGRVDRFTATVGLDDEVPAGKGSVKFYVLGDRKVLWESPVMRRGDVPAKADVDLKGVRLLGLLVTDGGDDIDYDHADWCDASLRMTSAVDPRSLTSVPASKPVICTPASPETPRINGAAVFGARPGHPFLYAVAATGKRPLSYTASKLPEGLSIDPSTGHITGSVKAPGSFAVTVTVTNTLGRDEKVITFEIGDRICLTPPMGWNSWNCWACAVDDSKVRASVDALVASGLADHGWSYINIDDCWEIKPDATDPILKGTARTSEGMINTNAKFPDMKALADYVHGKGLKLGIYSGPGTLTCAGFTASYTYERQDAQRYAAWGIDYLKYDWCSYERVARDHSLPELKKPYAIMRSALDSVDRDIVYSLCQYGMGDVWKWGAEVGGNCWRTTGDISDSWSSMAGIGFNQAGHELFAGPGHWNDPDMLVVGMVGWGPQLHPTHLTPDEQYTHISLWSLLASPLLIGCDLSRLDDFTLNLLTNDEVIAVNQDPLGAQAHRLSNSGGVQIWAKPMRSGSIAVGLFYTGKPAESPADYFRWEGAAAATVKLLGRDIGLEGKFRVRDLWRQKDLGTFDGTFTAEVPWHGVVLVSVSPAQ